jgi:hypothetical protein
VKSIGGLLVFFGVGSMVLNFLEREFSILAWIDAWGPEAGWAIRIGMTVVGAALWLFGNMAEGAGEEPAETPE